MGSPENSSQCPLNADFASSYTSCNSSTTHVFAPNLSASKAEMLLKRNKKNHAKFVTPDWVIDSAKRGKRVNEANYSGRLLNEVRLSLLSQEEDRLNLKGSRRRVRRSTFSPPRRPARPSSLPSQRSAFLAILSARTLPSHAPSRIHLQLFPSARGQEAHQVTCRSLDDRNF